MKYSALLLVFSIFLQTSALALTQAESEYRWNFLELKTRFSTHVSGSSYSYEGTGSGFVSSKDVESWYITKGGKAISETHYLRLLGDNQRAEEIESDINRINSINLTSWIISGAAIVYMFVDIFDGNDQYTGVIVGSVVALTAAFYPLFNTVPEHYLSYDEVGPQIDQYNLQLKRKLGLPDHYKL